MNLDQYGLPVQSNGDPLDQLHRCGMIVTLEEVVRAPDQQPTNLSLNCATAIVRQLQPKLGVFVRHTGGNPRNVSADQLISVLCAFVVDRYVFGSLAMLCRMILRLGFAQNVVDGLNGDNKTLKVPDFMLLRAAPLFARMHEAAFAVRAVFFLVNSYLVATHSLWWLLGFFLTTDIYLIALAIGAVMNKDPDHADDNNTMLTLVVCNARIPSVSAKIAKEIYVTHRPWNLGCQEHGVKNWFHPVIGAMRWYHRAENGGNPEIVDMASPAIKRYLFE